VYNHSLTISSFYLQPVILLLPLWIDILGTFVLLVTKRFEHSRLTYMMEERIRLLASWMPTPMTPVVDSGKQRIPSHNSLAPASQRQHHAPAQLWLIVTSRNCAATANKAQAVLLATKSPLATGLIAY